ncbi:hypothetical protein CH262_08370 [Rhodococcus sp. 05-2255-1e]|uniref:hypothetical protein n=1 Tax=Rhodococcus sp. 05-2255-1e TaxID=2022495 RepID=UPI000B9B2355|nr:hypothetical protein [Rhodococcus sp. 05-2255-1e]OZE26178.1 hypothetical protein CH262_08370 [Rhodococcus sp. 05-2255-1e]
MTTPNFADKSLHLSVKAPKLVDHVGDWIAYNGHLKTAGQEMWGVIEEVSVDDANEGTRQSVSVSVVDGTRILRYLDKENVVVVKA